MILPKILPIVFRDLQKPKDAPNFDCELKSAISASRGEA